VDQGEPESNARAECDENAGERPNQKVLREVPVSVEFVGPHNSLGSNEKSKSCVASPSDNNREDNAFQVPY
jgi:hypothetical protein